jgi:hypothetical protein
MRFADPIGESLYEFRLRQPPLLTASWTIVDWALFRLETFFCQRVRRTARILRLCGAKACRRQPHQGPFWHLRRTCLQRRTPYNSSPKVGNPLSADMRRSAPCAVSARSGTPITPGRQRQIRAIGGVGRMLRSKHGKQSLRAQCRAGGSRLVAEDD